MCSCSSPPQTFVCDPCCSATPACPKPTARSRSTCSTMPFALPVSSQAISMMIVHPVRSEEHTSELQSLMRISYAVFCLKKKKIEPLSEMHIAQINDNKATQLMTTFCTKLPDTFNHI